MSITSATLPVHVQVDLRLLAENIVDVLAERGLVIAHPPADTLLDADEVRRLLGRGPGRPLSYPTLAKYVAQGKINPVAGPDERRMYFSKLEIENFLQK